ncbi:hypothetical protein RUND412_000038 [Rhizina undulata]
MPLAPPRQRPRSASESLTSKASFTSCPSSTTESLKTFFTHSSSSSSRRQRLLTKVKQPFGTMFSSSGRKDRDRRTLMSLMHKKPSTLDFRCIGMPEDFDGLGRASSLDLDLLYAPPFELQLYDDVPRIDWKRPDVNDDWDANWFAGIGA